MGLAAHEAPPERDKVAAEFHAAMNDFKVLPGGRILSGCGTARYVTMCNTFVMRTIPDSVEGIMDTLKDAALTMQMGGGVGFDFSTLRPSGSVVRGLDCRAAGPLAAMDTFDATCKMIVSGMGRGAMMATMRCASSRHRSLYQRQIRPHAAAQLQHVRHGDERLHGCDRG